MLDNVRLCSFPHGSFRDLVEVQLPPLGCKPREAGQKGNVCVPSHSQRLGRTAPRTSEVGSSASPGGGGPWRAGCRPPVPPPGGLRASPLPLLSFPPPQGGQPWQGTGGRRAGLSFNQCRCHISCASEPTATSESFLTQGSRRPLPPGQN